MVTNKADLTCPKVVGLRLFNCQLIEFNHPIWFHLDLYYLICFHLSSNIIWSMNFCIHLVIFFYDTARVYFRTCHTHLLPPLFIDWRKIVSTKRLKWCNQVNLQSTWTGILVKWKSTYIIPSFVKSYHQCVLWAIFKWTPYIKTIENSTILFINIL